MIADSGNRREFDTGAVRDMCTGKGRMDLVPLKVISQFLEYTEKLIYTNDTVITPDSPKVYTYRKILDSIGRFIYDTREDFLYDALNTFIRNEYVSVYKAIMRVSIHYENGANKYEERNWEKGIPLHSYIDSAVRHLTKLYDGQIDEPHDAAFVWNILGALWTLDNKQEMIDLPPNTKRCVNVCGIENTNNILFD